jgi:glucokinase
MSETILAIDLGGTRFRAVTASSDAPDAVRSVGEWPAPQSLDDFTVRIDTLVAAHRPARLGVGIPGLVHGTICRWTPNLPFLDGLDLAARYPALVIGLGNDAQLALLAELCAGVSVGLQDAILLAIGTGIGSAVLSGGRIVAGSGGGACSFGWASADATDEGDDRLGWLERHASGSALDRAAQIIGAKDGPALVAAARSGDRRALRALSIPMRGLGTALAGAVALLDPEVVILAGGVAASVDVLGPLILPALKRNLPSHLRSIELISGKFGPQAGLVGAAFAGALGPGWRDDHG